MNLKQVFESALIIGGAALAVGFIKRTGVTEAIATRLGVSERRASLAGSVGRAAGTLALAATVPASIPYSVPLFYASVSELASSSIKPA